MTNFQNSYGKKQNLVKKTARAVLLSSALFACCASLRAKTFYIAPDGDDDSSGNKIHPFQTLERAASEMEAGDICYLREGRYRFEEHIYGISGEAGNPLVFAAYPGEKVLLDGTEILPHKWFSGYKNIYVQKLDQPIWQLFIDDELVNVARWPNASFEDGSIWRMEASMRFTDRKSKGGGGGFSGKTKSGLIYDKTPQTQAAEDMDEGSSDINVVGNLNQQTLAETERNFNDAVAVLNLRHWLTWTRPITEHKKGQNWFRYDDRGTQMKKYVVYYILGLTALDRPNEWWYDTKRKSAFIWAPQNQNPNRLNLRGKVRDYNLRVISSSWLVFKGLDFFGTTFSLEECDNVVVEDCNLRYPSTHKFMLNKFNWFRGVPSRRGVSEKSRNVMTRIYNSGSGPHSNIIRNCTIAYPNSPSISIESPGSIIENCYLHNIGWDVNSSGGSGSLSTGQGVTIRRNTIHTAGASEGIRTGPNCTVELNRLWHMGNLQHDGAAINIGRPAQRGTVVRYNWVHDTNRQGIRFDSTQGGYGTRGVSHHNLAFNLGTGGSKYKGDYHLILNNVCFESFIAIPNGFGNTGEHNRNTLVRNNLSDTLVAWNPKRPEEPIGADLSHNLSGRKSVEKNLWHPHLLDFRPKPDSEIIDAGSRINPEDVPAGIDFEQPEFEGSAPDIGAYEYGADHYWIPGRKKREASSPIPPDGSTNVPPDMDLMFLGGYKCEEHVLVFSDKAQFHKGTKRLKENRNILQSPDWQSGQTYKWRVDSVLADGTTRKGKVWTFTVAR